MSNSNPSSNLHGTTTTTAPEQLIAVTPTDARVTAMTWINESTDALLCLGGENGTVAIWRDNSTSAPPAEQNSGSVSVSSSDL